MRGGRASGRARGEGAGRRGRATRTIEAPSAEARIGRAAPPFRSRCRLDAIARRTSGRHATAGAGPRRPAGLALRAIPASPGPLGDLYGPGPAHPGRQDERKGREGRNFAGES